MNVDINSVLRIPEIRARLDDLVMVGPQTTRDEFDQFIRAEIARWARVIKEAGIAPQ
jgi:tripartite-type tricarboxylate transporter receptor subunit TctC